MVTVAFAETRPLESVTEAVKVIEPEVFKKPVVNWTTLQEEINYPQSSGRYEGRRMSFKRYAEAVLSTRADSEVSLDYVMKRADYWKNATAPIAFPNPPSFYY